MYQGYAANLVETAGKNGSVITDYQYQQNNYIDNQFLKDSLTLRRWFCDTATPLSFTNLICLF